MAAMPAQPQSNAGSGQAPAFWESWLGARAGEGPVAAVSLMYFFFIITSYYVLKPIREGLAIELGSQRIPALNILSMLSLIAANAGYSWLVGRYSRDRFITWITRACSISLVVFWVIFRFTEHPTVATAIWIDPALLPAWIPGWLPVPTSRVCAITLYFIWVNLFGLFSPSMFWSFINDSFSTDQGKRLYTTVGYGGLIGGLCGGIMTVVLTGLLGTANMFLVAAALLEPTIWCMRFIDKRCKPISTSQAVSLPEAPEPGTQPAKSDGMRTGKNASPWDGFAVTFSSAYLTLMALEMFMYTFASSMYSYQLNALMEAAHLSSDARTIYWANIYNMINGLSLLTQFFVTRFVMSSSYPAIGLLLLPLSQIVGSLLLIRMPLLDIAAAIGVIRYALNYSTGRAVRELFFTPLSHDEKYQGKGFIDTLVFRAGDGLSSVLLLWGLAVWGAGPWVDVTVVSTMCFSVLIILAVGSIFCRIDPRRIELQDTEKAASEGIEKTS